MSSVGRPNWSELADSPLFLNPDRGLYFGCGLQIVYLEKIRVFKAGVCLNTLAWNNGIGPWSYFVGFED